MPDANTLVYLLRKDLRVSDNPILHHLDLDLDLDNARHGFTHVLPVYVFPAHQMETSGFARGESPYPRAIGALTGLPRCGPHRARFICQSVWGLKESLEKLGSGIIIRVGRFDDAISFLLDGLERLGDRVGAIWMMKDVGVEEEEDETTISSLCRRKGMQFRLWDNTNGLANDIDMPSEIRGNPPKTFAEFKTSMESFDVKIRETVPRPSKLPPLPAIIPNERNPFLIPDSLQGLEAAAVGPVKDTLAEVGALCTGEHDAYHLQGGEESAMQRLEEFIRSPSLDKYSETREQLVKPISAHLSAFFAQGCLTARQVRHALDAFDKGSDHGYHSVAGYGKRENPGACDLRRWVLYQEYMKCCVVRNLYQAGRAETRTATTGQDSNDTKVAEIMKRLLTGTTGMSCVDASQRQLARTGFTPNRARQIVASFMIHYLGIDWRYGAEMYAFLLVDYDLASCLGGWLYFARLGNDAGRRGVLNPVHQSFKYRAEDYVREWVPELAQLRTPIYLFQPCTTPVSVIDTPGLKGLKDSPMFNNPLAKIPYTVRRKPRGDSKRIEARQW